VTTDPVSVVMPTRDRWVLATLALESVLAQEEVDLEVIVVDDGSRGPAVRSEDDPRVRVLRHERSAGVARARDAGLREARHPWVAFLDDDDLWSPEHLRLALTAADSDAPWAYSGQVVIDGRGRPRYIRPAPPREDMHGQLMRLNAIGTPSCVVARTELVRAIGSFDGGLAVLADWDLWFRLLERAAPARSERPTVAYRRHPGNMHLRMDEAVQEMERLRARHGPVGSGEFTTWVADGYRTRGARAKAARWYLRSARERRRAGDLLRAGGVFLGESAMRIAARPPEATPPLPGLEAAQRRQAELEAERGAA
jgi:glycosyltransferase involved in cell wall biosynthesis